MKKLLAVALVIAVLALGAGCRDSKLVPLKDSFDSYTLVMDYYTQVPIDAIEHGGGSCHLLAYEIFVLRPGECFTLNAELFAEETSSKENALTSGCALATVVCDAFTHMDPDSVIESAAHAVDECGYDQDGASRMKTEDGIDLSPCSLHGQDVLKVQNTLDVPIRLSLHCRHEKHCVRITACLDVVSDEFVELMEQCEVRDWESALSLDAFGYQDDCLTLLQLPPGNAVDNVEELVLYYEFGSGEEHWEVIPTAYWNHFFYDEAFDYDNDGIDEFFVQMDNWGQVSGGALFKYRNGHTDSILSFDMPNKVNAIEDALFSTGGDPVFVQGELDGMYFDSGLGSVFFLRFNEGQEKFIKNLTCR